jgi:Domain of unknown function (DUF3850)
MVHDVKIWPKFFDPVVRGEKTVEVRLTTESTEDDQLNTMEGLYDNRGTF